MSESGKIIPRGELKALGARLRHERRRIAFANGCFDLLHVGHVRYLEAAKAEAEVLVVGVNGDASVRELKGRGRPILPEDLGRGGLHGTTGTRQEASNSFDEPTVESLLRELGPDVHCKGTDYTQANVPEREVMRELGGAVRIVGDAKNHSTRDLLAEILRRWKGSM